MDLTTFDGQMCGMNGVFELLLDGVIRDSRWVLKWCGWDDAGQVRTMKLAWRDNLGKPGGTIDITIKENLGEQ